MDARLISPEDQAKLAGLNNFVFPVISYATFVQKKRPAQ